MFFSWTIDFRDFWTRGTPSLFDSIQHIIRDPSPVQDWQHSLLDPSIQLYRHDSSSQGDEGK